MRVLPRPAIAILLTLSLGACATLGLPESRTPDYASLVDEADAALALGQPDLAVSLLEQAGRVDVARKEPWLRLARLHAEAERYGATAQAAEEALKRDPDDAEARALLSGASLRIAARVLDRGRKDGWEAPAKTEFDALAKAMRAVAGPAALVSEETRAQIATLRARLEKAQKCDPKDAKPVADPFRALGGEDAE